MSQPEIAKAIVDVDGQQASQELKKLTTQADKLKRELVELRKANNKSGFDKKKKELAGVNSQMRQMKKATFDVTNVLKNLNGTNLNDLTKAQRKLNSEIKRTNKNTKEEIAVYNKKVSQLKRINTQISKTKAEMRGASVASGNFFSNLANGFNKYFMVITTVVASITGAILGFRRLVEISNEYEKALSSLSSITGLTGNDLEWLSEKAKELSISQIEGGIRITQSAQSIVEGYKLMGSAKPELLKNKEALAEVTKEALILAEAAEMDLPDAVNALANTMNQFNAKADETRRYINVLAAGSKEGAEAIPGIAEAIKVFGTVSGSANISIEESVALIETLAEKGIKGGVN